MVVRNGFIDDGDVRDDEALGYLHVKGLAMDVDGGVDVEGEVKRRRNQQR